MGENRLFRIVLTLDRDFWHLAVQRRIPLEGSGVVLFRAHPATPEMLEPLIRVVLDAGEVWKGRISIVSADGIQMVAPRRS